MTCWCWDKQSTPLGYGICGCLEHLDLVPTSENPSRLGSKAPLRQYPTKFPSVCMYETSAGNCRINTWENIVSSGTALSIQLLWHKRHENLKNRSLDTSFPKFCPKGPNREVKGRLEGWFHAAGKTAKTNTGQYLSGERSHRVLSSRGSPPELTLYRSETQQGHTKPVLRHLCLSPHRAHYKYEELKLDRKSVV